MIILGLLTIGIVLLVLFLILFLFGWIHIAIDARYLKGKPDISVKIFLWKIRLTTIKFSDIKTDAFPFKFFFKGKMDLPIKDIIEKQTVDSSDVKNLFEKWQWVTEKMKKEDQLGGILSLFRIHDIKWTTTLGLDEAPLTAFSVGVLWMIKYNLVAVMRDWLKGMEQPMINIQPVYQNFNFKTHVTCMITFRLGKAIHAAYRIAKIQKRRQVGQCQNIQYKA